MLVLSRKAGERIIIGDQIEVKIVRVRAGRVQIGIDCPRSISIDRSELLPQKQLALLKEADAVHQRPLKYAQIP